MAQCVIWQGGALVATVDAPEACQGFVLMQSTEYSNAMLLAQGLQVPTQSDIGAAFQVGFILPAMCYIVARSIRALFLWE